jgi:hypothetical protein
MSVIKISENFSKTPGARYYSDGSFSGQEFFEKILDNAFMNCVKNKNFLTIDLDGTTGYASSFLSEAFGLLSEKYSSKIVLNSIKIISKEEPDWINIILNDYIPNASNRKKIK